MAMVLINGANVNITDQDRTSLLFLALREECPDVFQLLLKSGASAQRWKKSALLLYMAAGLGYLEICPLLLHAKMHVDGDGDAGTPLLVAARRGHLDVCNLLIQHRARVEGNGKRASPLSIGQRMWFGCHRPIGKSTSSPLIEAAARGHLEIYRLLLDS
ncbi:ankyrin repeat-containing domain protein [Fusarium venenatum]|uniref:ankyrin repeat-containing domain protein n=1 Tax=Fusarium venenatum TaxID=56646 RepID=UPI001D1B3AA6|nr:ankyrin repeat-containing domain protein [Fusarium venenatum]